ncbi:MAG: hypothetical protein JXR94_22510 [Candidatus Hydrogenedentes bacterium]|nr:hypothetical protein [Candidatus Hydrogenedentota bacterium]
MIVQLGLFLTFLWVMNRLVLQPILRVMDERDESIRDAQNSAASDARDAQNIEARYAGEVAAARRESTVHLQQVRRDALRERISVLAERQAEADRAVLVARKEARARLVEERAKCEALAPELADAMAARIGLGGVQR